MANLKSRCLALNLDLIHTNIAIIHINPKCCTAGELVKRLDMVGACQTEMPFTSSGSCIHLILKTPLFLYGRSQKMRKLALGRQSELNATKWHIKK